MRSAHFVVELIVVLSLLVPFFMKIVLSERRNRPSDWFLAVVGYAILNIVLAAAAMWLASLIAKGILPVIALLVVQCALLVLVAKRVI